MDDDVDFAIPAPCPTECSLCGYYASTREERKHKCPVAAAINGANLAIGIGWLVLCVGLGVLVGHH